jgi:hypothetical protein
VRLCYLRLLNIHSQTGVPLLPGTPGAILARMPIRVKRVARVVRVLVLAICVAGRAVAESETVDPADRWGPALSLSAGFLLQNAEASIESGPILGPSIAAKLGEAIRPAARGDALMIAPDIGIGLDLLTPRVVASRWAPRFFVHAGVAGAFGPSRDLAKEGVIKPLSLDPVLISPNGPEIDGQGSRTQARVISPVVRAGAGIAFTVHALGSRFRVRTSFEYLREVIEIEGAVRRAVCIEPGVRVTDPCGATGVNNGGEGLGSFREIDLRGSKTQDYHGIGPGFEIETDVGRMGSIVPSVHIGAQAFRFLGKRRVSFSMSNEFGETATSSFDQDPWAYAAGVGLRLRWIPE